MQNSGDIIFGIRYESIINCNVELNIDFPKQLTVDQPLCCLRIKYLIIENKPLSLVSRTICLNFFTPDLCLLNSRMMAKKIENNCKKNKRKINFLKQKL